MARRFRQLVSLLRQRELGVRREWPDAHPLCLHQRPSDQGDRAQVPLGSLGPAACGPSVTLRARTLDHDAITQNRIVISSLCLSMIFSENRFPLFRIML